MDKNELIRKMAYDMNLSKSKNESEIEYKYRVVYSAMACWIRMFAINRENVQRGNTKIGIVTQGKRVLEVYLELFPELKPYFYTTDDKPISYMRNLLIENGNLMVTNENRIILSEKKYIAYRTFEVCLGVCYRESNIVLAGLSIVRYKTNDGNRCIENLYNSKDFLESIFKHRRYAESINTFEEYFDSNLKVGALYKGWTNKKPIENGFYIARNRNGIGQYDYYLVVIKDSYLGVNCVESSFVEEGNIRRLLYAQRKKVGNPVKYKKINQEEYILLKLYSKLPLYEKLFLQSFAWPMDGIDQEFTWLVPCIVWDDVKEMLDKIGLEAEE